MPWKETLPVDERERFVKLASKEALSMTALCQDFGVSRKTGYKWIERYHAGGVPALADRLRAPKHRPWAVDASLRDQLIELRQEHPRWGARKIREVLGRRIPDQKWPAASTIHALFLRHGLVLEKGRRRGVDGGRASTLKATAPNDTWSADFKGDFRVGDGQRVHPLTISDACSRFLITVHDVRHKTSDAVQRQMARAFAEHGLPHRMRTDNGLPFGSRGLYGLTQLVVWLIKLGVLPDRIDPGKPQQNGRHERMHRTLKLETAFPPAGTPHDQQLRFDRFRHCYNQERPHEALGMKTPAQVYTPSPRPLPQRIESPHYPDYFEVRRIKLKGEMRWHGQTVFVSEALRGEPVGLEPIDNDCWVVHFGMCRLALLHDSGDSPEITPFPYRSRKGDGQGHSQEDKPSAG